MSRECQGKELTFVSENNNFKIPGTLLILIHTQNEGKKCNLNMILRKKT